MKLYLYLLVRLYVGVGMSVASVTPSPDCPYDLLTESQARDSYLPTKAPLYINSMAHDPRGQSNGSRRHLSRFATGSGWVVSGLGMKHYGNPARNYSL